MATALITGASYGLGADFARRLGAEGYDLILVARSIEQLNELQTQLQKSYSCKVHVIKQDLADARAASELVKTIEGNHWEVELLINNAGFGDFGYFDGLDIDKTEQMMQLNMHTVTLLTRLLLPGMLKRRNGKILNVASTAAFQPGPLMAVYFATKAYVLSLSVALSNELKGSGVSVTVLCPGATRTHFEKNANLENSKLFKRFTPASSEAVAAFGIRALHKKKVVAVHGMMNQFMTTLVRFIPLTWQAAMVRKVQEKIKP